MWPRLTDLLVCPACGAALKLETHREEEGHVWEGILLCPCGMRYAVSGGIPRLTRPEYAGLTDSVKERTRKSFGYQWTTFGQMTQAFRNGFLNYVFPLKPDFFRGKLGLDAGCGFGRHLYYAAEFGAEVVGIDLSAAAEMALWNTSHFPGAHVVQADIHHPPFRRESFDFVYSIGVLHHLSDPEVGFQRILSLVKPGGSIFIWVYSRSRRVLNAALEAVRAVSTRLPFGVIEVLSYAGALVDWTWILLYRLLSNTGGRRVADLLFPSRVRLYANYPYRVAVADWFDRLSAPVRFYYDSSDLQKWASDANLKNVRITPTGSYGWRLYGER